MLKLKSKSLVITDPAEEELKQHIQMLIEKEEGLIKEKLERQQRKEARVELLEKQFMDWAGKKETAIKQKIEKSSKNKEDHLNKIVKKCQDHDKSLNQKFKTVQSKRRANLRQAWKKAEKYMHSIDDHEPSKECIKQPSTHKQQAQNELAESRFVDNNKQVHFEKQYISLGNPSKYYGNASKDYINQLNQSIRQLKYTDVGPYQQEEKQNAAKMHMTIKLKQTLARFKQQIEHHQQEKIQQLGERLQKIEKSRIKKLEMYKKKKQFTETISSSHVEKRQKKVNRSQRVQSECIMKQKRTHDWSESNKQKRQEYLQLHLQNSTNYLQSEKIKYFKTSLAKKIALSGIEKKLYIQRLNH